MMATSAAAPVVARREITVAARPSVAWTTLTGFERWPAWNPDVAWVRPDGPVAIGMTFRWKSGPGTIRTTIRELDPPRHLLLVGGTLGVAARHDWRLEPGPDGTTVVRTEETWSGPVARLLRARLQARLERRIDERLAHLRAEVERVAAADAAGSPPTG
jgi:hypothetical protein